MTLLDGYIRNVFGQVFSGIYLSGTLFRASYDYDSGGSIDETLASHSIKGQLDRADESMRGAAGYTDTDMKIIILQAGVSVYPNTQDKIELGGRTWGILSVRQDPGASHWVLHGSLIEDIS